jgi:hypothetical protein
VGFKKKGQRALVGEATCAAVGFELGTFLDKKEK